MNYEFVLPPEEYDESKPNFKFKPDNVINILYIYIYI